MPQVSLPYGDSAITAELPERAVLVGGGGGGERIHGVRDQKAAVREALANPLGMRASRDACPPRR